MDMIPQRVWRRWRSWNTRAGVDHELPTEAVVINLSTHKRELPEIPKEAA